MTTQIYPNTLNIYSEKLEKLVEDLELKFPNEPIHPKEQIESIKEKVLKETGVPLEWEIKILGKHE